MIYLVIIIAFLLLSYFYDYRDYQKGRKVWWILMLVLLICVAGFRYKMGSDSVRYENSYDQLPTLSSLNVRNFINTRYAPLYVIFCAICRSITREFVLLQILVAIFVNTVFFRFIYRNTSKIFIAAFFYFLFLYLMLNMQVLREAIAVSFFLLGWKSFANNKWLVYYLYVTVAFLFHVSAVLLFLLPLIKLPWIRNLFVFGRRSWIMIPMMLAISFGIKYFLFDFVQAIAMTETMSERAQTYADDDLGGSTMNFLGVIGWLIRSTLYPLVALYYLKRQGADRSPYFRQIEMMCMLSVYFGEIAVGVTILNRYLNYFMVFQFLVMSYFMYTPSFNIFKFRLRLRYLGWIALLVPLIGVVFYIDYNAKVNRSGNLKSYDMYYPYSNQFDKEVAPNRRRAINYSRRIR